MPVIELTTSIAAPVERVFDLARSIDLHVASTGGTGERAVGGVTSGLIGFGEEATWRARHFGVWQTLTVRITEFERPVHFADTVLRGVFRSMEHQHYFEPVDGGTVMRDVFAYASPLGVLGRVADVLFLERYLRSFLVERNRVIKVTAESDAWERYLRKGYAAVLKTQRTQSNRRGAQRRDMFRSGRNTCHVSPTELQSWADGLL